MWCGVPIHRCAFCIITRGSRAEEECGVGLENLPLYEFNHCSPCGDRESEPVVLSHSSGCSVGHGHSLACEVGMEVGEQDSFPSIPEELPTHSVVICTRNRKFGLCLLLNSFQSSDRLITTFIGLGNGTHSSSIHLVSSWFSASTADWQEIGNFILNGPGKQCCARNSQHYTCCCILGYDDLENLAGS